AELAPEPQALGVHRLRLIELAPMQGDQPPVTLHIPDPLAVAEVAIHRQRFTIEWLGRGWIGSEHCHRREIRERVGDRAWVAELTPQLQRLLDRRKGGEI